MIKAIWNDVIIAESDECKIIENNYYFPPDSVQKKYLQPSDHQTICSWKGTAHYHHVNVNGKLNENAAWYYPEPKAAANEIKGYIAFWHGVKVEKSL